ncbi:acetyltransferase [Dehalococcoides mccartyi]|jgi:RimJ/RimL family protein N-acetyltransferase|uniref:GNAT family N-acetyltransferase n=1 Tax=Dehalococcoides mccartyi TaxID=61435 RepID=UPI0004E0754A|nr:GNAT family N-acetyltransferase [Dehalococcoides mccartyi]AII57372.1 acetyltransferase [Dehalococcoides mccartyi CG1]APH11868.1 acetyltransferase [Dehalococcoides mccartyi]
MLYKTVLETPRLVLRPFSLADAAAVAGLAGDALIADTTLNIPHPYLPEMAEKWISGHAEKLATDTEQHFAITEKGNGTLLGACGLIFCFPHQRSELGYWIGKPYWNKGYATETLKALVDYAFLDLNLHRLYAYYFKRNPASGRVMAKAGLKHEGSFPKHLLKNGVFEDVEYCGLLRNDYLLSK